MAPVTTVPDVTTTAKVEPADGTAEWFIPTVNAHKGDAVEMKVIVKGDSTLPVAGASFDVDVKAPIAYASIGGTNDAYGAELIKNDADQEFAFGRTAGDPAVADADAQIFTINYNVPADAEPGTYPVTWANVVVSDTNGQIITDKVTLTDGAIVILPDDLPTYEGQIVWDLDDEVEAAPGEKVTLNVVLSDPDNVKLPVAGAQANIAAENTSIKMDSATGSAAYGPEVVYNETTNEVAFGGNAGKAATEGTVLSVTFQVPDEIEDGIYPVKWEDVAGYTIAVDENGTDITENIKFVDGSIKIVNPVKGEIEWDLEDKVPAEPGSTVTVNALVVDKAASDLLLSGAQFKVVADPAIKITGITGSDAYGAEIVYNPETNEVAFATASGAAKAAKDGDIVFAVTVEVPEGTAAGEYPVEFVAENGFPFVSDASGKSITDNVKMINGSVLVPVVTTTTTAADTTTAPETTTTTEAAATTTTEEAVDTTTTEAPVTTVVTTTATPVTLPEGAIAWQIDTVHAKPGQTGVQVPVYIIDESGVNLPIGGAQFRITNEDGVTYVSSTGSDAYGVSIVDNPETREYAFASSGNAAISGADQANVVILTFDIPDTASGEYPVTFDKNFFFVSSIDGLDMSDRILTFDGAIIIDPETTTTTEPDATTTTTEEPAATTTTTAEEPAVTTTTEEPVVTTTTTEEPAATTTAAPVTTVVTTTATPVTLPEGAIAWQIDTVHAKPGQTGVQVPVYIIDESGVNLPIGGAQFRITNEDGVTYVSSTGSDAYGVSIVDNPETREYAFASSGNAAISGADQANVVILTFDIPDTASGEYPVTFDKNFFFVSSIDGLDMSDRILTFDGAIIIDPETTTTVEPAATTTTEEPAATTTTTAEEPAVTTTTEEPAATTTSAAPATTVATTTTTPITVPAGKIIWQVGTATATPGTETELQIKVLDPQLAKLAVSGANFIIDTNGQLQVISSELGDAYNGAKLIPNGNEIAFATSTGLPVIAEDGSVVLTFKVAIPEDIIPEGQDSITIPVSITGLNASQIIDPNEINVTDNIITLPGSITIVRPVTTTTTETPVVTTTTTVEPAVTTTTAEPVATTTTAEPVATTTTAEPVATTTTAEPVATTTTAEPVATTTTAEPVATTTTAEPVATTTTAPVTTDPTVTTVRLYAECTPIDGYYFSHDSNPYSLGHIGLGDLVDLSDYLEADEDGAIVNLDEFGNTKIQEAQPLKLFTTDGENIVEIEVDQSKITFQSANDAKSNNPAGTFQRGAGQFKYEINVLYDGEILTYADGTPVTFNAYIGVKGDVDFDLIVDATDASAVLVYYAAIMTGGNPEELTLSPNTDLVAQDRNYDELAAFLGDVDTNEYSPVNFRTKKPGRIIDATDASAILVVYSYTMTTPEEELTDDKIQEFWDDACPERKG